MHVPRWVRPSSFPFGRNKSFYTREDLVYCADHNQVAPIFLSIGVYHQSFVSGARQGSSN